MLPWFCESEENLEASPGDESLVQDSSSQTWREQGGVMSCGGVYLGLNPPAEKKKDQFEFVVLAKHIPKVLVFNRGELYPSAEEQKEGDLTPPVSNRAQDRLKRFFRENLN